MSAVEVGLIKTMEDAVNVLRHASQPLGGWAPSGWSGRPRNTRKKKTERLRSAAVSAPSDLQNHSS